MKKLIAAAAAAALIVGAAPARGDSPADCQSASKKKLNDKEAGLVNLTPVATTIAHLVSLPAMPSAGHPRGTFEKTTFRIHATITFVKWESDQDLHAVISDGVHHMIVEAPNPPCAAGSRVLAQLKTVRAKMQARFPTATASNPHGVTVSVPATVTGVGFFDTIHAQTGVAPNGVELHPLIGITFG